MALLNINQYQSAVDALEKSINLKEDWETSRNLAEALLRLGKEEEATAEMQKYFRKNINQYFRQIDPCLEHKDGVIVTREDIRSITDDLSKLEYAFHPSYFTRAKRTNYCNLGNT